MNPVSQAEIESEIMRLSELCEKATHEVRKRGEAKAKARTDHAVAFAQARLRSSGTTVGEREDEATVETAALLGHKEFTEALFESAKEAGRNYRAQLDALRSINANLRPLVTQ